MIPEWIKSVCRDYGNSMIDESTFLNCIQFLVDHGEIKLPNVICPASNPVEAIIPESHVVHVAVTDDVKFADKPN